MRRAILAGSLLGVLASPAGASAHGIAQRADLPIPAWLFAWGAALVLIASFVALSLLWPRPRLTHVRERTLMRVPAALEVLCGAVGIAAFAAVVYAGLAGNQTPTANLAPTAIFVLFWVGLPFLSVLFGDVFAAFNPWRAVARAAAWAARRTAPDGLPKPLAYPERLGRWPAAAGVLAFVWLELVYVNRDQPSTLAVLALAYAAVMLVGMSIYGIETWTRNADTFAVTFGLYALLSPLNWRQRRVALRPPLVGAPGMPTVAGSVALVCVLIGTTSFDGFSQGAVWTGEDGLAERFTSVFTSLGFGQSTAVQAGYTLGLLLVVALVSALYWLGVAGMQSVGRDHTTPDLARRFAHTLVPISLAYVVAHYFSLLLFQGQAIGYLISDPLGDGSDLLGTANRTIDYNLISANGIWYAQVAALLAGHICGLILAHDRALSIWRNPRTATRSQYWMLLVMVTYTCLGLWLLSSVSQ